MLHYLTTNMNTYRLFMTTPAIHYQIEPSQGGHRFLVNMHFTHHGGQLALALPIWIPGSYTRRDFSKHISQLQLSNQQGEHFPLTMTGLSSWSATLPEAPDHYQLSYRVYARDQSVRGCYLDHERAVFNPCCACIMVEQQSHLPHQLRFNLQQRHRNWHIAGADNDTIFDDYHHLIDSPFILAANIQQQQFELQGIRHDIVITGHSPAFDIERLSQDVAKVCHEAVHLFGRLPNIARYQFLLHLTTDVYGGLEHRASTLLMAPRDGLPSPHANQPNPAYIRLLGLFSHEYFHTWNIKDLVPKDYQPYNLHQEQPSEMLWLFEGFTAYFDNWLLMRSGVISEDSYLSLLAADISAYWQRTGRLTQTLAQSSYEAWTKLYNGGEDAINSSSNYYVHGALMAFCLDVFLRCNSDNRHTLASVIASLWQQFQHDAIGLDEPLFRQHIDSLLSPEASQSFQPLLSQFLHSHEPLPLKWACEQLGLSLQTVASSSAHKHQAKQRHSSDPGFTWQTNNNTLTINRLDDNSPAALSGLAVGDKLVAVNHLRATAQTLSHTLHHNQPQSAVTLHIFRDSYLYHFQTHLQSPPHDSALLRIDPQANSNAQARRRRWFKQSL